MLVEVPLWVFQEVVNPLLLTLTVQRLLSTFISGFNPLSTLFAHIVNLRGCLCVVVILNHVQERFLMLR